MWDKIANVVGQVAPFLGTMLGGPMGGVAGRALKKLLCKNENASDSQLEEAILNATPADFIEMKKLNYQFEKDMAEVGITREKLAAMDRDSARKRQVAIKDNIPAVLSIALTLGFFALLAALFFYDIPAANRGIIDIMLGSLGSAWIGSMTYYFGSSYGSQVKTAMLAK